MSYGTLLIDIIDEAQKALSKIAPSFDDEKHIVKHDVPARYVWVLEDSTGTLPPRTAGAIAKPGGRKEIITDPWRVSIHCWGYDAENPSDGKAHKALALKLRQALLTVLEQCLPGDALEIIGTRHKGGDAHATRGWVCIVDVDMNLPLYAADIANSSDGNVVDLEGKFVRPTSIGFDASGSTAGDRKIHVGEDQA